MSPPFYDYYLLFVLQIFVVMQLQYISGEVLCIQPIENTMPTNFIQ
jgi:hypothetical protein